MSSSSKRKTKKNATPNMVPAGDIAREVGYTSDYITRLAREKKIKGKKVGKKWLVDPASVAELVQRKQEEKEARSKALRRERKREQLHHSTKTTPIGVIRDILAGDNSISVSSKKASIKEHQIRVVPKYFDIGSVAKSVHAVIATSGIMLAGVLVGVVAYSAPVTTSDVISKARALDTAVFVGHIGEDVFEKGQMIAGTFSGLMDETLVRITPHRKQYAANVFWSDVWCGFKSLFGKECLFDFETEEPTVIVQNDIEVAQPVEERPTERVVQQPVTTPVVTPTVVAPTTVTNPIAVYTYQLPDIFPAKWLDQVTSKEVHIIQTGGNMTSVEDLAHGVFERFGEIAQHFVTNLLDVHGDVTIDGQLTVNDFIATSTITTYSSIETPFITATSTTATSTFAGGLAIETTGFVYDFASNKVGIGTAAPETRLTLVQESDALGGGFRVNQASNSDFFEIVGIDDRVALGLNGSELFSFTESGRVGIGTSSPTYALEVIGDARFSSSVDATYFTATSTTATSTFAGGLVVDVDGFVYDYATNRVGIGTTSPFVRLAVAGDTYIDGTVTATTNIETPYFVATDANATSTFAGGLVLDINGFVYDYASNHIGLNTTNTQSLLTLGNTTSIISTDTLDGSDNKRIQIGGGGTTDISRGAFISLMGNEYGGEAGDLAFYAGDSGVTGQGALRFFTDNLLERLTITAGGNIGIGTTTPAQLLSVAGNGYLTGGFGVGVATTTPGAFQTSGNGWIGGDLVVVGDSTVFGDSATLGESSADTLVINSSIGSDLIPTINATYDVGSPSFFWDNGYFDTITANNISAASSSISGTQSETFTINSDNASADIESMDLIFFRGTVVPNALISWNAVLDKFDINQPLFIQNDSATTTIRTLDVLGSASQTADIFRVASSAGSPLFTVRPSGKVGIGNASPENLNDVADALVIGSGTGDQGLTIYSNAAESGYLAFNDTGNTSNQGYIEYNHATNYLGFGVNNSTEAMRIASNGSVGIGTTNPLVQLHVEGSTGTSARLRLSQTSAGGSAWDFISATNALHGVADGTLIFRDTTNAANRMVIDASGNIGIGTNNPTNLFEITPTADNANHFVVNSAAGNDRFRIGTDGSTHGFLTLFDGSNNQDVLIGANGVSYFNGGNVGIGTTTPAFKFDVQDSNAVASRIYGTNTQATLLRFANLNSATQWNIGAGGNSGWSDNNFVIDQQGVGNRFVISNAGNVGIGTTTPQGRLHVEGASVAQYITASSGDANLFLSSQNTSTFGLKQWYDTSEGDVYFDNQYNNNGGDIFFRTKTTGTPVNALSILGGGNVGVGTATPEARLDVTAGTLATGPAARFSGYENNSPLYTILELDPGNTNGHVQGAISFSRQGTTTSAIGYQAADTSTGLLTFSTMNAGVLGERMRIANTGNVGIGNTNPSYTLDVAGTLHVNENALAFAAPSSLTGDYATAQFVEGDPDAWALKYFQNSSQAAHMTFTSSSEAAGDGQIRIGVGTANNLNINNAGNVGIGNTSPDTLLDIGDDFGSKAMGRGVTLSADGAHANLRFVVDSTDDATDPFVTFTTQGGNNFVVGVDNNALGTGTSGDLLFLGHDGGGTPDSTTGINITTSGNVGLGTINPQKLLHLSGDTQGIRITNTNVSSNEWDILASGTSFRINDVDQATRLAIDVSGNVGIGTTNPSEVLHVQRDSGAATLVLQRGNAHSTGNGFGDIEWRNSLGSVVGRIIANAGASDADSSLLTFTVTNNAGSQVSPFVIDGSTSSANFTGNVGIGTSTPSHKLHVYSGATDHVANFESSDSRAFISFNDNATTGVNNVAVGAVGDDLYFRSNNSDRMVLDSSGNVGIGTTSPNTLLHLESTDPRITLTDTSLAGAANHVIRGADQFLLISADDGNTQTTSSLRFNVDGSERVRIDESGNLGIGVTNPSGPLTVLGRSSDSNAVHLRGRAADNISGIRYYNNAESASTYIQGNGTWMRSQASGGWHWSLSGAPDTSYAGYTFEGGNVGVGTTTPQTPLHVYRSANGTIARLEGAGTSGYLDFFEGANNRGYLGYGDAGSLFSDATTDSLSLRSANALHLGSGAGADLTISTSGNIGVGTANPGYKLHVFDSTNDLQATIETDKTNGQAQLRFLNDAIDWRTGVGSNDQYFVYDSTNNKSPFTIEPNAVDNMLYLDSTGNVGVGTANPNKKFTVNISNTTNPASGGGDGLHIVNTNTSANSISTLLFSAHDDGAAERHGAAISFGKESTWTNGSNNYPGYLSFWTRPTSSSVEVERMRITSAGNVGIGTTSPGAFLDLEKAASSGQNVLRITSGGGSKDFSIVGNGGNEYFRLSEVGVTDPGLLEIKENGTTEISLSAGGVSYFNTGNNVGIGTTNPQALLHVHSTTANAGIRAQTALTDGTAVLSLINDARQFDIAVRGDSSDSLIVRDQTSGSDRFAITSAGNVGIGTTAPASYDAAANNLVVYEAGNGGITVAGGTTHKGSLTFADGTGSAAAYRGGVQYDHSTDKLSLWSNSLIASTPELTLSNGNVGIGTTSPTLGKLQVQATLGSNTTGLTLYDTTYTSKRFWIDANGYLQITNGSNSGNGIVIGDGAASGNVGIGTSTPQAKLHTFSNVATNFIMERDASNQWAFLLSGGSLQIQDKITPAIRMAINSSGNVGIGETSPAARLHVNSSIDNSSSWWLDADASVIISNANALNGDAVLKFAETEGRIVYGAGLASDKLIFSSRESAGTVSESVVIDNNGNLGVGGASGGTKLEVRTSSATVGQFTSTSSGRSMIRFNSNDGVVYSYIGTLGTSGGFGVWDSTGNESTGNLLTILNSGNVGIGTTSPDNLLHVEANTTADASQLKLSNQSAGGSGIIIDRSANTKAAQIQYSTSGSGGWYMGILRDGGSATGKFHIGTGSDVNSTTPAISLLTNGNLGLGNTSPDHLLHLQKASGSVGLTIEATDNASTSYVNFGDSLDDNVGAIGYVHGGNYMNFTTNASERMRINSAGNVGIGETDPENELHVAGRGFFEDGLLVGENTGTGIYPNRIGGTYTSDGSDVVMAGLNVSPKITGASGDTSWQTLLTVGGASGGRITTQGASEVITNVTGVYLTDPNIVVGTGDTITNASTLKIASAPTEGVNNYGLWVAGGVSRFDGSVGIGLTSPDARLHVANGDAGSVTVDTSIDDLIVENSTAGGISIYTPDASTSSLAFGSPSDANGANIQWNYNNNLMTVGTRDLGASIRFDVANGSEAMRINSSGNVGIGTTTPEHKLEINVSGTAGVMLNNSANYGLRDSSGTSRSILGYAGSTWGASGGDALWIRNPSAGGGLVHLGISNPTATFDLLSNKVGIGTTSPVRTLHVNSGATDAAVRLESSDSRTAIEFVDPDTTSSPNIAGVGNTLRLVTNGADRITVAANGNIGIGETSPSAALDVLGGGVLRISGSATDATNKIGRITNRHYTNAEEDILTLSTQSSSTDTVLYVGGGSSVLNAATQIVFRTAANTTTLNGTTRMQIDSAGSVLVGATTPTKSGSQGLLYVTGDYNGSGDAQLQITGSTNNNKRLRVGYDTTNDVGYISATELGVANKGLALNPTHGRVGIGTINPQEALTVIGDFIVGANTESDTTTKHIRYSGLHYTNSEEPLIGMSVVSSNSDNLISIGGGSSIGNAATTIRFMTATNQTTLTGTERMRIDSVGNVGIGTADPANVAPSGFLSGANSRLLDIYSQAATGDAGINLVRGDSVNIRSSIWMDGSAGDLFIDNNWASTGGDIRFRTQTAGTPIEALTITGAGNVGIGTASPGSYSASANNLVVSGGNTSGGITILTPTTNTGSIFFADGTAGSAPFRGAIKYSHTADTLQFNAGWNGAADPQMILTSAGDVGIGTTSPYAKLSITNTGSGASFVVEDSASDSTPFIIDATGDVTVGDDLTVTNALNVKQGAPTAPSIRFAGLNTGFHAQSSVLTVVDSGTNLFQFQSGGLVGLGGNYAWVRNSNAASTPTYSFGSDGNTGTWSSGADTLNFSTGGTERMRITSSGYVGIGGTPVGDTNLHILSGATWGTTQIVGNTGTGASTLILDAANGDGSGSDFLYIRQNNDLSAVIRTDNNAGSLTLGAGGDSNITLIDGGNVGIGTTTPDSLLNIVGADPILLIKDTATATAGAVASVRFAESGTGGVTDNYWDVGVPTAGAFSFGVEYNGSQKLTIDTSGRVGIGTTSPVSTLSVQGSLCVRDTGTCGTTAGTIYATNASVTDIDLAENYPTIDDSISAGEIVTLDPYNNEYIKRASFGDTPFGIISTAPGLLLGGEDPIGKPVALKGRVPVKVNLEGGDIVVGDRITLSQSEPGVGTKATESTRTIGIALEPFNASSEGDTIVVAVENEYTFVPNDFALKSQNTGFGTTSPYAKLAVVNESAGPSFIVEDSTGGDTTPFIVDAGGKVGIGTSTPTAQLHTTGSVRFENFGAGALQTDANGNLTVSSDERLKDIEGSFDRGLEEIRELEPIMYRWNEFSGFERETLYAGFSAQNVQDSIPEAVGEDKYGFLTLADRPILAAAINAIKELDLDIQTLAESETLFSEAELDSFLGRFLGNLRQWFADTANGIGDMIAGTFKATEQLCINDTCVSEEQLQQLLNGKATPVVPEEEPDTEDDENPSSGGGNTNTGTTTDDVATTTDDGIDDVATSTDDGTDTMEGETATSTEDGSEETVTEEEPVEEEVVEETPEEEDPVVEEEPEPEPEPEPTPEPEPEA